MGNLEKFVIDLFIFEVTLIFIFLLVIPLHRIYLHYKKSANDNEKKQLSQMIINCLEGKHVLPSNLPKLRDIKNLLLTLEMFEYRISGNDWEELKDKIAKIYLLPLARKKANSSSWIKRNFSSRCFALCPIKEDQEIFLKLINDPIFLVRAPAALALARFEHKQGIVEILKQMSHETGYAHFFYRDVLLNSSKQVFELIQEIAKQEKDSSIHLACLEVLDFKAIISIPDYLLDDIRSNNEKIRWEAVKILARNPQKKSVNILIKCLEDPVPEIREAAILGLEYFPSNEVFSKLEYVLQDSIWPVRLRAAQTLKKMGEKGINILKHQSLDINKNAYNVSQIILQNNYELYA